MHTSPTAKLHLQCKLHCASNFTPKELHYKNTCEANIESQRDISIRRNIDPGGNIDIGSAFDIAALRYIAPQFDIRFAIDLVKLLAQ